jgi:AraC-like DNA-binding protein
MLEETDASLSEIAGEMGYSGITGFVRAFKSWTGKTPVDFRR